MYIHSVFPHKAQCFTIMQDPLQQYTHIDEHLVTVHSNIMCALYTLSCSSTSAVGLKSNSTSAFWTDMTRSSSPAVHGASNQKEKVVSVGYGVSSISSHRGSHAQCTVAVDTPTTKTARPGRARVRAHPPTWPEDASASYDSFSCDRVGREC